MKSFKLILIALLTAILGLAMASPAFAAGSYGGAGTPFSIYTFDTYAHGYLPSPPASVPSTSTITGVSYALNYSMPGAAPGNMDASICASTGTCTNAYRFTNSTTVFNGLSAKSTTIYFIVRWTNGFSSGTISGGPISFTDSLTVNYT